jgi:uncharacterized membrane protein
MPSLAPYHPQIVHFVIALAIVGIVFRLISLTGRFQFTNLAATTLIVLGALGSFAAVRSGDEAHGPAERIPGAREAVHEHEEWGVRARNALAVVAVVDLLAAVALARGLRHARLAAGVAAAAGLAGAFVLYEAAEHGGELVYSYAGGVGTSSGVPEDVQRLLIAGVYHQAMQDREAGRGADSADLVETAARRFPEHLELQLMAVDWLTEVHGDPAAALARLDELPLAAADRRVRSRAGVLRANALAAQGNRDGALALLRQLQEEDPDSRLIRRRLAELGAG